MIVYSKSAKYICAVMGLLLIYVTIQSIIKFHSYNRYEATVDKVINSYTENRTVRSGNDGGLDSYEIYGVVCDITIHKENENIKTRISITRRDEAQLPSEGDTVIVTTDGEENYFEYQKETLSLSSLITGVIGICLIIIAFKLFTQKQTFAQD